MGCNIKGLSESDIKTDCNTWGNFANNTINYTGRKAYAYYNGSSCYFINAFGNIETSTTKSYLDGQSFARRFINNRC